MTHEQAVRSLAAERYILEEMTAEERGLFEEHYFSCADCASDLRAGALLRDGARTPPVVARVAPFVRPSRVWYRSAAIPWATAAALALAVGYQSLVRPPGASDKAGPAALSPITLRPANRGQEPTVSAGPSTPWVTLAVDVMPSSNAELEYDVLSADGAVVVSGHAPVPSSGGPLLLLIPARAVSAPGNYTLSVKANGSHEPPEEYRFKVVAP